MTSTFIAFRLLKTLSKSVHEKSMNYILIIIEILYIFAIRIYCPKTKLRNFYAGILIFLCSFVILFSSLGCGLIVSFIAVSCCLVSCIIVNLSLFIPFLSFSLCIRIFLHFNGLNTAENILKVLDNNYILLLAFPAIILSN